ncbi:hypothetical protein FH609_030490 [Streptomyces sp. 3MP-14]|uniref:Uncharacterized protein n=1 Tax=Streptomyces mimosae TaxID=2586635 RepID=A0A5N5ZNM2_9ACTN|nr:MULTISPECIES: hypothetical protein [Streptomyces]KAB8157443.1 hypothetical protein FH607_030280 [Streptomyces mimosae]KAB8172267.1 hypothetical protein FH609_030490 [Streptomyces sp. 3MP-14]
MDPTEPAPESPDRPAPRPEQAGAAPVPRPRDPVAAGLGNACLLGAGYLLLGRWRLAAVNLVVTVVLVAVLASGERPAWFRVAVLLWWGGVTAHGWWLAGGWPRRSGWEAFPRGAGAGRVWSRRLLALGLAGTVLLTFAALRADASGMERDAASAHRDGDCARALSILDGLGAGHRVADGRLVARADDSAEACELLEEAGRQARTNRLRAERTLLTYEEHPAALWEGAPDRRADLLLAEAGDELDSALDGDIPAVSTSFDHLAAVLAEFPGREDEVGEVMNDFLDALPSGNPCTALRITTWLGGMPSRGEALDRAADVVPEVEPAAIVGCGDDALGDEDWDRAREQYEQLLDEYPDHALVADAERGIDEAETAIEFERLRELVQTDYDGDEPAYCDDPAPYRGAAPYRGGGPHPALIFGQTELDGQLDQAEELPGGWLAEEAADAVLIICVGEPRYGSVVETCDYEFDTSPGGYASVTFHTMELSVRAYEVRTGQRLDTSTIEIGGNCPSLLTYTYYGEDPGPPANDYVFMSTDDIRDAYGALINP